MADNNKKIIFVYNITSDLRKRIAEYGKAKIRRNMHKCKLHALTNEQFTKKRGWRKFLNSLPYETEFVYKDELEDKYPQIDVKLPAILVKTGRGVEVLLNAKDFENISTIDDLKASILGVLTKGIR